MSNKKAGNPESQLSIEWWPIARPKPYAKNARTLSARAIETLAKSLKEFGWRQPIVVDVKDVIVAGHTRLLAAKSLGMTQVPVHVARELTAAQIRAYRIMDNRSADETDWDMPTLEAELAELAALEVDLSLTGFEAAELAELMKPDPLTDEDDTPPIPETPVTRLGDLWLLGNHRVLCGDALSVEAVSRVCGPTLPQLVFTDPPYGANIVKTRKGSKDRGKIGSGAKTRFGKIGTGNFVKTTWYEPVIGDEGTGVAKAAVKACLDLKIPVLIFWGGNYYASALPDSSCWIVWDKRDGITPNDFADCELAWTNRKTAVRKFAHTWSGLLKASEKNQRRVHPTQKPVALAEWCFERYGAGAGTVLDLFLGSGSTLIACQKTDRACVGLELSPAYVDVIVNRWQLFTGQAATLEGDGRTFEKIAASRPKEGKRATASR